MHQGNWTCSGCGATVTELPFEPRDTSNLLCKECHSKKRDSAPRSGGAQGERKMFKGEWTCSKCNTAITELPFEPRDTSTLMCKDCFKKSKEG
jgi:CxxC-x17-CxxC domain-containing protein